MDFRRHALHGVIPHPRTESARSLAAMNFCSLPFLVLLVCVFLLYWRLDRHRQNILVVIASAVFYGWWDVRFMVLMYASALLDYWVGLELGRDDSRFSRKALLGFSLAGNLGMLGFFKYFNFFADSAVAALQGLGFHAEPLLLQIVLPVGISFYTFQTLSYSIDVYRRQFEPTRDFFAFVAFVTFFPQLVAGPIERASHLLPQFLNPRTYDMAAARDGLRQTLWGFIKKIAVADVIAGYTPDLNPDDYYSGSFVIVKTMLFAFQIYYDFSAYSDIAIGTAKLFGFSIMRNFANPYFSRDFSEFWHRWHISLSTWFRDYVYIPLGGSRLGEGRRQLNLLMTFMVSGLWHGANWTFVVWGLLNGIYVLGFSGRGAKYKESDVVTLRELPRMMLVFILSSFAWIFFWSKSLDGAISNIARLSLEIRLDEVVDLMTPYLVVLVPVLCLEWITRRRPHPLDVAHLPVWARWTIYTLCLWFLFLFGNFNAPGDFIYFQF